MTKVILSVVFAILIISQQPPILDDCNYQTAQNALPPRIFAETTIDGSRQSVLVTRFFHNKINIFASAASGCFAQVIDPNFIEKSTTLPGLFFWLYCAYQSVKRKVWLMFAVLAIVTLLPFFKIFPEQVAYSYKIFAIIGLFFWLR